MPFALDPPSLDSAPGSCGLSATGGSRALCRLSRNLLLLILFVVFAGGMSFLISYSPLLLYGSYVAIILCSLGILALEWPTVRNLRSIAPYLGWIFFYCYWGALTGPPDLGMSDLGKLFVKNLLLIGGFSLALASLADLRRMANLVQIAVLLNVALAVWEYWHPDLVVTIALYRDINSTAFNPSRPGGLWSNPDEAAFALIFAMLVSRWARPPLSWAGRVGSLIGIFLSASRTGAYVLMACGAIYFAWHLVSMRLRPATLAVGMLGIFALAGAFLAVTTLPELRRFDLSKNWHLKRILDFSQKTEQSAGDPKRSEIASDGMEIALEGPWYGQGAFSFQKVAGYPHVVEIGVHNIFLAVFGETGFIGIALYLSVLGLGLWRLFRPGFEPGDRLVLLLMWMSYLAIGLTWHNQFTSFVGMIYVVLLFHLPVILEQAKKPGSPSIANHESSLHGS